MTKSTLRWSTIALSTLASLALSACGGDGKSNDDDERADAGADTLSGLAGCGDGERAGIEQCDNGEANSNSEPNACRTDCRLARCGDGVVDDGESCDDGNAIGGDGCSPACDTESGTLEVEPNDELDEAQTIESGTIIRGGLPAGDIDCYAIAVGEPGWIEAETSGDGDDCPGDTLLQLFDPSGNRIATDVDSGSNRCSHIDPQERQGARYLDAGTYTVCVSGVQSVVVADYLVQITADDTSCDSSLFPPGDGEDWDLDGSADPCDPDDDNDGVDDVSDNCPLVFNGPSVEPLGVNDEGFITDWLMTGGIPQTTPDTCLPDDTHPFDPLTVLPELGDTAGDTTWIRASHRGNTLTPYDFIGRNEPEAVYAVAYVISPAEREGQLRLGSDDGFRVWLNGVELGEGEDCRGVSRDQNNFDVTVQAGTNVVLMQTRSNSGGFGHAIRFTDAEGAPFTDLELKLTSGEPAPDNQTDSDGDGIGDACDPEFNAPEPEPEPEPVPEP